MHEQQILVSNATHLHQNARPLRGGEGNFVHEMTDVPAIRKETVGCEAKNNSSCWRIIW